MNPGFGIPHSLYNPRQVPSSLWPQFPCLGAMGVPRASGSPTASLPPPSSLPAASCPPNPPARVGGLPPLLSLFRPRGAESRGPGRSYSRTWAAGGGASVPPAGGSSAARPEWGPTAGGPGAAPDASCSGTGSWPLQKGRITRGRGGRDPAPRRLAAPAPVPAHRAQPLGLQLLQRVKLPQGSGMALQGWSAPASGRSLPRGFMISWTTGEALPGNPPGTVGSFLLLLVPCPGVPRAGVGESEYPLQTQTRQPRALGGSLWEAVNG